MSESNVTEPEERKTIEISVVSVNNLKDCGIYYIFISISILFFNFFVSFNIYIYFYFMEAIGKMDPFIEFDYCQSDVSYWTYKIIINENHGTSSEWLINQTIDLHLPTNNNNDVLKIRVKDKNDLKSDTLIGKCKIPCENLTNTQWNRYTIKLQDKKEKFAGNLTLHYRFNHIIPQPISQLRLQRLHHKIQNFQPTSTNIIPFFTLIVDSVDHTFDNPNQDIYLKYKINYQIWFEQVSQNPLISTSSSTSTTTTTTNPESSKIFFFQFNEKKINDNFNTLQHNYKTVLNFINEFKKV